MELEKIGLTPRTNQFLNRNNISVEILENCDLPTFIEIYFKPNKYILQDILRRGFLKPKNGEKYVRDLDMSNRLINILEENGIFYLSKLKYFSQIKVKKFRNLGNVAYWELITICNRYNINLYSMPESTPQGWKRKRYYTSLENYFARKQIVSLEIFQNITTLELYEMCEQDYMLTAILYKFLSEIQRFKRWKNAFIFEYIEISYTTKIYWKHKLMYMSELNDSQNSEAINNYQSIIKSALRKWNKEMQQ